MNRIVQTYSVVVLLALVTAGDALAQKIDATTWTREDLRREILNTRDVLEDAAAISHTGHERSVPLAIAMSALIPGSGQGYNRQWIKAGTMLLTEAALITGYAVWKKRGLDGEDAFRSMAHASWNPAQYANWLNDYSDFLVENHGAVVTVSKIDVPGGIDFTRPDSWDAETHIAVTQLFTEVRTMEGEMFHPETGASFSHRLPFFGEQQYYELIGKYFQFAPGWVDYAEWRNAQGFTGAIDPETSGNDGEKVNVTDSFFEYASDHAQSQTFLRRASRVTAIIFVNHILAAADAGVFSKLHNDRISTRLTMSSSHDGFPEPGAQVNIRF